MKLDSEVGDWLVDWSNSFSIRFYGENRRGESKLKQIEMNPRLAWALDGICSEKKRGCGAVCNNKCMREEERWMGEAERRKLFLLLSFTNATPTVRLPPFTTHPLFPSSFFLLPTLVCEQEQPRLGLALRMAPKLRCKIRMPARDLQRFLTLGRLWDPCGWAGGVDELSVLLAGMVQSATNSQRCWWLDDGVDVW